MPFFVVERMAVKRGFLLSELFLSTEFLALIIKLFCFSIFNIVFPGNKKEGKIVETTISLGFLRINLIIEVDCN